MPAKHRKHTPIRSQRQRALFGAELARRRAGEEEAVRHRIGGI